MRTITLSLLALTLLAICGAEPAEKCQLTIELLDAQTGKPLPGLVQIRRADGSLLRPAELLSRGYGLEAGPPIHDWQVLPRSTRVVVPRELLTLRAFAGLETDVAEVRVDLTAAAAKEVQVPLQRFYRASERGYRAANTHLHLRKISREQADRYLIDVPLGDGLDVVFLSYLERAVDDLEYTSNKYTLADLHRISQHGAKYGNGQEHRHNFAGFGEGYGHVMFLNIPELVQPVSIGPGIMKQGTDGLPLRAGIEKANSMGSKVIWCHNKWGLEDIPNWVMGRLHANNIFDGGTHGSYKHSFYRYLNAGLRVPFSTGTDWFMYDFSRVYVPATKSLSPEEWLDVLAQGRSIITNGPLLELTVNGKPLGDTIDLPAAGAVQIEARCRGRIDFERIELLRNGTVAHIVASKPEAGHFVAEMKLDLSIDAPCWLALRTPPPPVKDDPEFQRPVPKNELGCDLFGHTSATFVALAGRKVFDLAAAESLLAEMKESHRFIDEHALFADNTERARVLAAYDEALAVWEKRIQSHKAAPDRGPGH